jgi:hypothetical protein
MGLTYSFMMPHTHHEQRRYEYVPKLKQQLKKYNNYKKSRIISTELINPIESTKEDKKRDIVKVFECNVEK